MATACLIQLVWQFVKQKPWPLNCDYELALNLPRTGNSTEIILCWQTQEFPTAEKMAFV